MIVLVLATYVENQILGLSLKKNENPCIFLLNTFIQALVLMLLPIYVAGKYYDAEFEDLGITVQHFIRNVIIGVIAGLFFVAVVSAIEAAITSILGKSHDQLFVRLLMKSKDTDTLVFIILAFSAVFLAPISEKVFNRGFAYAIIKKRYGKIASLILSSIFFVALHFDIWNALYLFIVSIGLTLLFERTKSLVPGITAHALINLSTVIVIMMSN
jgi:membrane protease YdiL (CAAX protease family)